MFKTLPSTLTLLAVLIPSTGLANDQMDRINRAGRWLGIGFSDGYHKCEQRSYQIADNLPLAEPSSGLSSRWPRRGGGCDGSAIRGEIVECCGPSISSCDTACCDQLSCDATMGDGLICDQICMDESPQVRDFDLNFVSDESMSEVQFVAAESITPPPRRIARRPRNPDLSKGKVRRLPSY